MGEQKKSRKVFRAQRSKGGKVSDIDWKDHYQLFNHLIAAGPSMHGPQGQKKKKSS